MAKAPMRTPAAATLSVFLLLVLVLSHSWTLVFGYGGMVGGRTEIKDVEKNKEVQELGRFAVGEYNRKHGGNGYALTFAEVVEAEKQVVSGIKYYLKIKASEKGVSKMFESVVVVKAWLKSKQLLNFAPSTD